MIDLKEKTEGFRGLRSCISEVTIIDFGVRAKNDRKIAELVIGLSRNQRSYNPEMGDRNAPKYADNKLKDTWKPYYHDYLVSELPFVAGTVFDPAKASLIENADGYKLINLYSQYNPSKSKKTDYDLLIWFEYLERLFPDREERKLICQWLAHMFQKPEQKPSWHLLLTSDTGTGKGFLFEHILLRLLNHQAVLLNSFQKLTGKHSTVLENNLLIFLDDTKTTSDHLMTELKSLLSDSNQLINPKGLQEKKIKTYCRFILASNEYRPLKIDRDERRWFVPMRLAGRDHTLLMKFEQPDRL